MKVAAHQEIGAIGWAEIKLLAVVAFFLILGPLPMIVENSQVSISPEHFLSALLPYFICESVGVEAGKDCQELLDGVRMPHFFNISMAPSVPSGSFTLVVFLFSTNFSKHYRTIKERITKYRTSSSVTKLAY